MIPRALALMLVPAAVLLAQPAPPPTPGWIGIGIEDAGELAQDADAPAGLGLKINQVFGESPGWIGGLRTGDVVVRIDGKPLEGARSELVAAFKATIAAKSAGERVRFVLRRVETRLDVAAGAAPVRPATARGDADPPLDDPRGWLAAQPPGTTLAIDGAVSVRRLEVEVVLGVRPGERAPEVPRADPLLSGGYPLGAPGIPSELARLSRLLVRAAGARAPTEDLARRLATVEAGDDGFRLDVVRALHVDPFRLEAATDQLGHDLLREDDPVAKAPWAAFRLLGAADPAGVTPAADPAPATTPAELLARIDTSLARAVAHVELAFAAWTAEERTAAPARLESLFEVLGEGIYLFGDLEAKPTRRAATLQLMGLAKRVDLSHLERARAELAWIIDRDTFLRALAGVEWGSPTDRARAIVAELDTPRGKLAIAGTGNDVHREQDYAVLVELGGDDIHANSAGASVPGKIPVSIVVDLGGDDAYESHRRYAQGTGALGVGALVDHAGDDLYVGTHVAQGCGVFGLGLLVDHAGSDRYRALTLSQGMGLVGVGAVVDLGGDDRYDAQLYAQGLGLARGVGVVVDRTGDDEYYAKGLRPTGYDTAGVFDAWSQGCGLGFRLDASGGIGILADGDGRDRYEAGNFGQGGGYYYGWGALVDLGGDDDRYVASRYGMGWSAHQALGSFLEDGGDDRYATRHGVICGLAWDESATVFVDRGGDDRYDTGFFSLGASAHNAVCVFADLGGRDRYRGAPPGRVGGNDYHGGTSWSSFVDAGGEADDYGPPTDAVDYGDDRVRTGPEHWGFADLPGRVADALVVAEAATKNAELPKEK